MNQKISKFRGFTLFEVLLLLFVASVITVAALRYAKHQQEVAADQTYGLKLYTLGQAVSQYIASATQLQANCQLPGPGGKSNPSSSITLTNCTPGGNGTTATLTASGVDWLYVNNAGTTLMGSPFLPKDFSFAKDLGPLQMATVNPDGSMGAATGDHAIITTVTFTQGGSSPPTISIQAGGLFETKGVDSKGNPIAPVLMPALTQDAITHANTLYSASQGGAAINYTFPYLPAGGGSPQPSNVQGAPSQVGVPYLQVEGSNAGGNSMLGILNFDPSAAVDASVSGINSVAFVGAGPMFPPVINNLENLSFLSSSDSPQVGVIGSLSFLNFAGSGNGGGTMNFLQKLNFDTGNASPNNSMTGVDAIGFRHAGVGPLEGIKVTSTKGCQGMSGNSCDTGIPAKLNGKSVSACFIGRIETTVITGCNADQGAKQRKGSSGCGLGIGASGNWMIINTGGTEPSSAWGSGAYDSFCEATCIIWATAAWTALP
jgi:type II secretory pathway pseudopilin PulG